MPTELMSPPQNLAPALDELARHIERAVGANGIVEPFESVWVTHSLCATQPSHALYMPMLCIVAQGSKQVLVGDEQHVYDSGHFLLNSVTLPATGQVLDASPQRPYLGLTIHLDPVLVGSVIMETGLSSPPTPPLHAMEACPMEPTLLDAVLRLARLFNSPEEARFLKPMLLREIIYRLLTGSQAARLHQIVPGAGQTQRVASAIAWLRDNYAQPLTIEKLARESGMSPSALHHHFKDVTAMSPLQFQKQLRLQEAKRLMMSEGMDVANAGFRVGYEDPSYFSRDYKRFFGASPRQHIERIRGEGPFGLISL